MEPSFYHIQILLSIVAVDCVLVMNDVDFVSLSANFGLIALDHITANLDVARNGALYARSVPKGLTDHYKTAFAVLD